MLHGGLDAYVILMFAGLDSLHRESCEAYAMGPQVASVDELKLAATPPRAYTRWAAWAARPLPRVFGVGIPTILLARLPEPRHN